MTVRPIAHLSADDLDALLTDSASPDALQHVALCDVCRIMVQADRSVVARLHALPPLAPRPGFRDRVMARVTVAVPAPVVAPLPWPRRILGRPRVLAVAAGTVAAMALSATWTMANRELLDGWIQLVSTEGGEWLWSSLQAGAAALTQQAWYAPVRDLATSPIRAAAVLATGLLAWSGGVLALRRLMALPAGSVPGARA